jgi:hypothetical protein
MVGVLRGNPCANVFHYQLTTSGTISQADLDTWTTALQAAFKTRLQAQLPTDYTFSYAKTVLYAPGGGELVSTSTPTAWAGTGSTVSLAGSACAVLSWQSGVYWRGGKPRTYIPLVATWVTAGTDQITVAQRAVYVTQANLFRTDSNALTAGTITATAIGFVSFRSGNAERGTPLFFAVTGVVVHPRVGSQRRRNGKWLN